MQERHIKTKEQAIEFAEDRICSLSTFIPETESDKKVYKETLEFLYFVKEYLKNEKK